MLNDVRINGVMTVTRLFSYTHFGKSVLHLPCVFS
jgi:hypothetical protein